MLQPKGALIPRLYPGPNRQKHQANIDCCPQQRYSTCWYVFNLRIRYIGLHKEFPSCFCLHVQNSAAFTTHKPLLPMCLLYTQLAQLSPPCATTHLQMGAFQSCWVSCCLFQIHQTKLFFARNVCSGVTPCEQMCSGCKWATLRGCSISASGTFGWKPWA